MQFSLDDVRSVARVLQETNLAEISIEATSDGTQPFRLRLRRNVPVRSTAPAPPTGKPRPRAQTRSTTTGVSVASAQSEVAAVTSGPSDNDAVLEPVAVTATAVGLFRAAEPPLQVGDSVRARQIVGSVESLRVPNEVTAPIDGRIKELLAEEGQGVEYGQILMTIEPAAPPEEPLVENDI